MRNFWIIAGVVLFVGSALSLIFGRAEGISGGLFGGGIICLVLAHVAKE